MKKVYALGLSLACVSGVAASLATAGAPVSQTEGSDLGAYEVPEFREIPMAVSSGDIRVTDVDASLSARALQVPVWEHVVEVGDADWVRLRFSEVVLARSTQDVRESYLRITSLEDGYEQYLDVRSLREWGNTTAYFNGGAVKVEIMASPNASGQFNRVEISGVQASAPRVGERSICGPVDDRELSYDNRDARLMPIGCTAWLFTNHGNRMMSAAHCGPSGGDVIQFNVPLSSNSGSTRNPPPEDQYPVDNSSVQDSIGGVFIGNDWAYFGVFDNSNTGLSPVQAYGLYHTLAESPIAVDGRPIRITGYGSTFSPVPASWYLVQKTHTGPLSSISGNTVRYRTDTTGGNSGSAILDENNQVVIGVHTNAGCNSGGGSNQGTSIFNSDLQDALDNPLGICQPRNIQASVLFEPTHIDPAGGDTVTLVIDNLQGHTVAGSPRMFVDAGEGYFELPMTQSGDSTYDGTFASYYCGAQVSYYFEVEDEEGTVVSVPESGAFSTLAVEDLDIAMEDDFQTNQGWESYTTGGSGGWVRTIPADHGQGDPGSDADGSGRCYVTSNANGADVDNGSVMLMTPLIDLTGVEAPVLRLAAWMTGSGPDSMLIEFTDNAGATWVDAMSMTSTSGWEYFAFDLEDYVDPNIAFRMRVTVTDAGADSTVEGGIDAFKISSEVCGAACPADLTGDGNLDFFDVSAFLSAFNNSDSVADFNSDGELNFFDVSAFLAAFNGGCP